MIFMTIWALIVNQINFGTQHNTLLQTVNLIVLVIAIWITIEGVMRFFKIDDEVSIPEKTPV